jgi:hypothetical protein
MRKNILKLSGLLLLLGFVALLSIYGCGKTTQEAITGSIAPSSEASKGGSLYDKYKDKFPANLMELTPDDMINKLTPHVIQAADGTTIEVYVTYDVMAEVAKEVEESYPKYDPEKYLNEKAEEILKQSPAIQSIIMSGVGSSELSKEEILEKAGYTEEEFKERMQEELEAKEKRIAAEKSYMIFSELAEPEVQNKIKASVAEIQAAISNVTEVSQYIKEIFGRGPNKFELRLLATHPHYIWGTWLATRRALERTTACFGDYKTQDDKKGNSFQHSFWNVLLAKYNEGVAWWGKRDALWWAEAFATAHEEYDPGSSGTYYGQNSPNSKNMDLHNNRVGRRLYDQKTYDSAVWTHIYFLWWRVASIHVRNIAHSPSEGTFENILYNRAVNYSLYSKWENNRLNPSPGLDQLVYVKF